MKPVIAFVLVLGLAMAFAQVTKPTKKQLKKIRNVIHAAYKKDKEFAGRSVRLSFHDCIGTVCDGCVDVENEGNAGLGVIIDQLNDILKDERVKPYMTRADLWAFAGKTNIEYAIKKNNNMCKKEKNDCPIMDSSTIVFNWGRKDCAPGDGKIASGVKANGFPEVDMTRAEMMDFFAKDFGFTEAEVTALIGGAHSLGRARINNTGYDGAFSERGNREWYFNNEVFTSLTKGEVEFRSEPNDPDSADDKEFQFNLFNHRGRRIGMMLNTEVQTAYNIDLSGTVGTQCKINDAEYPVRNGMGGKKNKKDKMNRKGKKDRKNRIQGRQADAACPRAATYDLVKQFADDQGAFITAFSNVFTKMIEKGNDNLEPIVD